MKKRVVFAALVLVAGMHACNLTTAEIVNESDVNVTQVTKVLITPPSSPGDFNLEVTYESMWTGGRPPGSIICRYITPDGATIWIGTISVVLEHKNTNGKETNTSSIPFSVKRNGVVTPGQYVASCTDERNVFTVESFFFVIGTTTEIPLVAAEPPVTIPTSGTITYDEATEQLSPHRNQWGYYPSQHHKWCAPTLTIDSTGNISGTCHAEGHDIASNLYGDWNSDATIEGTITGSLIPGGSFTFREELTEKYKLGTSFEFTRKVVILGTGSFSTGSAMHAAGTATFDADCSTVDNYANICGDSPSLNDHFTGTIAWEFNSTALP
jgi:hypothetical protein